MFTFISIFRVDLDIFWRSTWPVGTVCRQILLAFLFYLQSEEDKQLVEELNLLVERLTVGINVFLANSVKAVQIYSIDNVCVSAWKQNSNNPNNQATQIKIIIMHYLNEMFYRRLTRNCTGQRWKAFETRFALRRHRWRPFRSLSSSYVLTTTLWRVSMKRLTILKQKWVNQYQLCLMHCIYVPF